MEGAEAGSGNRLLLGLFVNDGGVLLFIIALGDDVGDGGFFEFNFHIVRDFDGNGAFLDIGGDAVHAADGDDLHAGFEGFDFGFEFLLAFALRADEQHVEDDEHQSDHDEGLRIEALCLAFCLSEDGDEVGHWIVGRVRLFVSARCRHHGRLLGK